MAQAVSRAVSKRNGNVLIDALHIFVLSAFALAQPLLDVLSHNAEFFVAHHSEPVDVVLLMLILCVGPPALVVVIEAVAGLVGRQMRKALHYTGVACLVAVIALPALNRIDAFPGAVVLMTVPIVGIVAAISYSRSHAVRMFVTVLSPSLFIFPGLFLFGSPASQVVFLGDKSSSVYANVNAGAPVVMIVFDEFPVTSLMNEHRQIDPIRYPNFAAVARDAYWFRNSTTVSDTTFIAIPAILTGQYPDLSRVRLPTAADYPLNMFTLLDGSYELVVFEPVTRFYPERRRVPRSVTERMASLMSDVSIVYLHILLPRELAIGLPSVGGRWKDFAAGGDPTHETRARRMFERARGDASGVFAQFIGSIRPDERRTLYFLHINLPHLPWRYLPSGKAYAAVGAPVFPHGMVTGKGIVREKWDDDDWEVVQGFQRHLLQVGFVDKLVGQLMARLKGIGLYDRSLIVITADHGVSFRPNDFRRAVSETNFHDIMAVPLFIKAPYQHEGVTSDRNVETIDIVPTIADILDITVPWPVDGRSALDVSLPERPEKVIFRRATREVLERFVVEPTLDGKYDTLERKLALFGSGTKPDSLFKIGPHNYLVGQRLSELSVERAASVAIELEQASVYDDVNPEAAFVPAHIVGHVRSSQAAEGPFNLAIAVNGTIRAVTRTFDNEEREGKFTAMVPETALRAGKNSVEVFVISAADGELELTNQIAGFAR